MFWKKLSDQAAVATGNFARLFGDLDVPPLPQVAVKLLALSRREDVELEELAKVIASDTGLTSKIMSTANSAALSLPKRITDIHQAVSLLGTKRIQSLALAYSVAGVLPSSAPEFDPEAFWQSSLQQAAFARALCSVAEPGTEGEAFTGALLQNMALPILLSRWGEYYGPIVAKARETERDLILVETDELEWTHAQAGAWMARNWGLPDVLVCCIGLHHATVAELASLRVADTLLVSVAVSSQLPDVKPILATDLKMDPDAVHRVLDVTDTTCSELAALFGVTAPQLLVDQS